VFDQDLCEPLGRVLLVEDHPVNQRVGTVMLEHLGFDVDVVADGAEAVKAAMLAWYHAILMDCQIPGLDGFDATVAIRNLQRGATRRTPIIAVTACDLEADQERCLAAGMDGYLRKPLNLRTLAAAMARWAPDGITIESEPVVVGRIVNEPTAPARPILVADPGHPVLDVAVVARLARLGDAVGENLIGQLAVLFRTDATTQMAALREALVRQEAEAVVRSAHSLSGASANLGATHLARLFSLMATDAQAGELARAPSLLAEGEAELTRVVAALAAAEPDR
jgi:CheY-like chemotaxis protein/HPt (histidine-containing phosphotransfer) domain-containing protein